MKAKGWKNPGTKRTLLYPWFCSKNEVSFAESGLHQHNRLMYCCFDSETIIIGTKLELVHRENISRCIKLHNELTLNKRSIFLVAHCTMPKEKWCEYLLKIIVWKSQSKICLTTSVTFQRNVCSLVEGFLAWQVLLTIRSWIKLLSL